VHLAVDLEDRYPDRRGGALDRGFDRYAGPRGAPQIGGRKPYAEPYTSRLPRKALLTLKGLRHSTPRCGRQSASSAHITTRGPGVESLPAWSLSWVDERRPVVW
jgi:hypothetical protein